MRRTNPVPRKPLLTSSRFTQDAEAGDKKPKTKEERDAELKREFEDGYRDTANAMLATATFAGAITLSIVLTPGNTPTTIPGVEELAYASSLFLGSIMGCILIIASIGLGIPRPIIRIEVWVVGTIIFVAFYLLLHASSYFLTYRGPFILGSIIYLGCGFLILVFSIFMSRKAWWGLKNTEDNLVRTETIK